MCSHIKYEQKPLYTYLLILSATTKSLFKNSYSIKQMRQKVRILLFAAFSISSFLYIITRKTKIFIYSLTLKK